MAKITCFLLARIHTFKPTYSTQVPSTRASDGTLVFPNILLCPFQQTGKVQVMSAVHYPNLYGLVAHPIKSFANHSLKVLDLNESMQTIIHPLAQITENVQVNTLVVQYGLFRILNICPKPDRSLKTRGQVSSGNAGSLTSPNIIAISTCQSHRCTPLS